MGFEHPTINNNGNPISNNLFISNSLKLIPPKLHKIIQECGSVFYCRGTPPVYFLQVEVLVEKTSLFLSYIRH